MRRLVLVVVVCALVAAPALAAHMGTATFLGVAPGDPWHDVMAGQYNLTTEGLGVTQGDNVPFGTFCIEWNEHVAVDGVYSADVSYAAIQGGEAISDPLNPESAYLYDQYLKGILSSQGYTAADVQIAIWSIENELPVPGWVTDKASELITLAAGKWTDTGIYRVVNLWNPDGTNAQDFIVSVPIPAAVLLGMLGMGVAGLKLRKYV